MAQRVIKKFFGVVKSTSFVVSASYITVPESIATQNLTHNITCHSTPPPSPSFQPPKMNFLRFSASRKKVESSPSVVVVSLLVLSKWSAENLKLALFPASYTTKEIFNDFYIILLRTINGAKFYCPLLLSFMYFFLQVFHPQNFFPPPSHIFHLISPRKLLLLVNTEWEWRNEDTTKLMNHEMKKT